MSKPTDDTPQEREDKAAVLATRLKWFKWEVRLYYATIIILVIVKVT